MAVAPADLKNPTGKIDSAFFPGEATAELEARLQTYITEGATRIGASLAGAEKDEATKLWAYYRAFEAIHLRMIATPASFDITGEGSVAFTGSQIAEFGTKAAEFRGQYDSMLDVESTIEPLIPSGAVTNAYRF